MGDNCVQAIDPGDEIYSRRTDAPDKLWTSSIMGSGSALNNSLLVDAANMVSSPDSIYGWMPGSLPYNGQSSIGDKASMGSTQPIRHQRTYAHERVQNFGLFQDNVTVNIIGVDVENHLWITEVLPVIKPASQKDIMVPGLLTPAAWVGSTNYCPTSTTSVHRRQLLLSRLGVLGGRSGASLRHAGVRVSVLGGHRSIRRCETGPCSLLRALW